MKVRVFLPPRRGRRSRSPAATRTTAAATPPTANDTVTITQANPPPGGDLGRRHQRDLAGGFMMGNPNAKVKLVEIGSLSCPHCQRVRRRRRADPDRQICEDRPGQLGIPRLRHPRPDRHGREPRRALQRRQDLLPARPRRCTRTRPSGSARSKRCRRTSSTQMQNLPPNQVFVADGDLLGLQDWAAARGVPQAKSNQCLSDQKMIDQRGPDDQRRQQPVIRISRERRPS